MKAAMVAGLFLLCVACGPAPPPDARDFVPEAIPPGGPQPWEKGAKKLTVGELKAKVLALMREGVDQDLILAYVSRQRLSGKMTVDDILDWNRAGISEEVIKAAAAR